MFLSKEPPIEGRDNKTINLRGWTFYDQWCAKHGGRHEGKRPRVKLRALKDEQGDYQEIFIDLIRTHFKNKDFADIARRLRLLPCVKDLLENSEDAPEVKEEGRQRKYIFRGMAPDGEKFIVFIQEKKNRLALLTFYPSHK
ncbi:MAG: hypothetical protein HQK57_11920 [Deltaproteobacteria bacterium]|nr:hypothetical protein [Deltaproteobacteria bacterium]MBF0526531.1 hypothetical protein [Deltaproteobacteria bacterium]